MLNEPFAPVSIPVTIVTPVYNGEDFIEETLNSVLEQKYPELEYVVVDDGSHDRTPELLANFGSRIRILHQENQGEPAAVNAGVRAASYDIIAIVNADDPILPGLITAATEELAKGENLVAVYPDWQSIDERGAATARIETLEYDFRRMLEEHYCIPGPGTFFRRSAFGQEAVRSPAFPLNCDFEAWLRLGLRGNMRRIPQVLASWRRHDANTSMSARSVAMAESRIRIIESFFARDDLPESIRMLERQALSAAYYFAAVLALHDDNIPARRYLWKSLMHRAVWPAHIAPSRRRSVKLMSYFFLLPLSRPLKTLYGRYLDGRGIDNELSA